MLMSATRVRAQLGSPATTLNVISSTIGLDDNWQPFVQASLVCSLDDPAFFEQLDPRIETTVSGRVTQSYGRIDTAADLTADWAGSVAADLTAEYAGLTAADLTLRHFHSFDGGAYRTADSRSFVLCLRGREIDYVARTVTLELASDESVLEDFALVEGAPFTPPGTYIYEIIDYVLALADRVLEFTNATAMAALVDVAASAWTPGTSAMSYLTELVRPTGLYLWADEFGSWTFSDQRKSTTTDALVVSSETNLIGATDRIRRDGDWFTAAVITYIWEDANGVTHTEYDTFADPGYLPKVYTKTLNYARPVDGNTAQNYVQSFLERGREQDLVVVADITTYPGRTLHVTPPVGSPYTAIVSAVSWKYPDDTMTIKTRSTTPIS